MAARPERRRQLEAVLSSNHIAVGTDDEGLQALNDWYRANVEASRHERARLSARWYAIGLDIGLYLGEAIIERAPSIEWRLFTHGRSNLSYHRPVLMGFSGVRNPKSNVDPELLVGTYGHQLIDQLDVPSDRFVQIVRDAVAKA
jgi:hypothetical protein